MLSYNELAPIVGGHLAKIMTNIEDYYVIYKGKKYNDIESVRVLFGVFRFSPDEVLVKTKDNFFRDSFWAFSFRKEE